MSERCDFPLAEVGLGQMRIWRRRRLEYAEHGEALVTAARLFRERFAGATPQTKKRKRRPPLQAPASNGMLGVE